MRFLMKIVFGNRFKFLADRSMIRGGANSGNRDTANAWYEYDGR